jgi:serine/threonine protein phosphatase PrpC
MIEWSAAGRPLEGEHQSGDRYLVDEGKTGALFAVIDGLGHGPAAAEAAAAAVETLKEHRTRPLPQLFDDVHQRLKSTRGAVMTVAQIDDRTASMSFCGVGNVEGAIFHKSGKRDSMVLQSGIVGGEKLPLKCRTLELEQEDLVVLASDGIRGGWTSSVNPTHAVKEVADTILLRLARKSDDALVLAVRWRGRR